MSRFARQHQATARIAGRSIKGSRRLAIMAISSLFALWPALSPANDFCPNIYEAGTLHLPFNAAFTHIDSFKHANGNSYDGLIVTSFFNAIKNPDPNSNATTSFYERDLVARITGIGYRSESWWNPSQAEILTDLDLASPVTPNGPGQQVWPNEAKRVPDGILPFEAIASPQGLCPCGDSATGDCGGRLPGHRMAGARTWPGLRFVRVCLWLR